MNYENCNPEKGLHVFEVTEEMETVYPCLCGQITAPRETAE